VKKPLASACDAPQAVGMDTDEDFGFDCPTCGARNTQDAASCQRCGALIGAAVEGSPTNPSKAAEVRAVPTFRLRTLMAIIGLIAVCLALLVTSPALGVLVLMFFVPPIVWTWYGASRYKASGGLLADFDFAGRFAAAFGVTVVTWFSVGVAGVVTCTGVMILGSAAGVNSSPALVAGFVLGGLVVLTVAVLLIRRLAVNPRGKPTERGENLE
jgi:hypothetical protein